MNRVSVVGRIVGVVAGLVFVLAANGEAFGLHRPCPHHEGGHGVGVAGVSAGEAEGAGHVHGHAGHGATTETDEGSEHGPCSCLGSCVVGAAAVVPVVALVESELPVPDGLRRVVPEFEAPAPAGPREHRLPFPNGPPLD